MVRRWGGILLKLKMPGKGQKETGNLEKDGDLRGNEEKGGRKTSKRLLLREAKTNLIEHCTIEQVLGIRRKKRRRKGKKNQRSERTTCLPNFFQLDNPRPPEFRKRRGEEGEGGVRKFGNCVETTIDLMGMGGGIWGVFSQMGGGRTGGVLGHKRMPSRKSSLSKIRWFCPNAEEPKKKGVSL